MRTNEPLKPTPQPPKEIEKRKEKKRKTIKKAEKESHGGVEEREVRAITIITFVVGLMIYVLKIYLTPSPPPPPILLFHLSLSLSTKNLTIKSFKSVPSLSIFSHVISQTVEEEEEPFSKSLISVSLIIYILCIPR